MNDFMTLLRNIKPIRVSKKMLEIEKMILSKIKRSRGSRCRQNLKLESACRFGNVATFKNCRHVIAPPPIDMLNFWRQQVNALTAMGFVAIIRV